VVIHSLNLEAISKMQTPFKDKPTTTTADKARADEKAESAKALWRMSSTFRGGQQHRNWALDVILR
jgi:hypothetical protein